MSLYFNIPLTQPGYSNGADKSTVEKSHDQHLNRRLQAIHPSYNTLKDSKAFPGSYLTCFVI